MKIVKSTKIPRQRPFQILLLTTLCVRIILFFIPGFRIDIGDWEGWASRLNSTGFSNFYSSGFSDYFPGYLYILWGIGKTFHFIFPTLSFTNIVFEIFIKSVTTIFDIGSTYYIYKLILKHRPALATKAAFLYFANPAVIFNSSVWGQIDGIMVFFLIYSVYSLTELAKPIRWSFFYSLGILIKPQSLALMPIMLVKNFQVFRFSEFAKSLILIPIFLVFISTPFFHNDLLRIFNFSLKSINVYPFTSLFAFNFWALFDWWKNDNTQWFGFSYKTWGLFLFSLSLILIIMPFFRRIKNLKFLYIAISLSLMAFYLFPTRIHERYLLPFLSFILIASLIEKTKEKLLVSVYLLTSIVHFINLWYVYYYYNFVYNNASFSKNIFYLFINSNYKFFSLTLLANFFLVIFIYYRSAYVKKS